MLSGIVDLPAAYGRSRVSVWNGGGRGAGTGDRQPALSQDKGPRGPSGCGMRRPVGAKARA